MRSGRTAREWAARCTGLVGVRFGTASIAAGGSVLAGRDPGYLTSARFFGSTQLLRSVVWVLPAVGVS